MITDLLRRRASVRRFQDRPVPDEIVQEILEAGRLSPSGGNQQPWLFGVITDRERIARLAELACGQRWIAGAPLVIVLCTVIVPDEQGGRDIQLQRYPEYAEAFTALDSALYHALNEEEHQTKIAGAHMALAALEHGVGSCWISRFRVNAVAELLQLPEGTVPGEMLVLGYPEGEPRQAQKKPLDAVVFYERPG